MVLYNLIDQTAGSSIVIPLFVVSQFSSGSGNSIVVYESPGSNGGVVINTGRLNTTVTLTGSLIGHSTGAAASQFGLENVQQDLTNQISLIMTIKDLGRSVKIDAPLTTNNSFIYIIREFKFDYTDQSPEKTNFTLVLDEVRQDNSPESKTNIIGADALRAINAQIAVRAS